MNLIIQLGLAVVLDTMLLMKTKYQKIEGVGIMITGGKNPFGFGILATIG